MANIVTPSYPYIPIFESAKPYIPGILAKSGSSGSPTISFSNAPDTGLFNPVAGTLGVVAGGTEMVRVSDTIVSLLGDLVVSSNIVPMTNATQYIGTSTMHFKEAWIDELHISSNTLYIGDTPVICADNDAVSIRADPGKGITLTTTGDGETSLVSAKEVNVVSEGGVTMRVSGPLGRVNIQSSGAGGTVNLGAEKEIVMTAPLTTISSNMIVKGDLTVEGTQLTLNTQTVTVEDNIIVLNSGEIGSGVSKGEAGFSIYRGDAPEYQLLFRESDNAFVIGPLGSLTPIATETFARNANNISSGTLAVARGGTGVSFSTGTGETVLSDNATMSNLTTIGGMISGNGSGLTALNANNISSGTLAVARGGTGVSASTGTGSVVLSFSPTFTGTTNFASLTTSGTSMINGNMTFGTGVNLFVNPNDSVTAPGYSWNTDTNTGMYRVAADSIGFAVGGVNKATINSTGIVGSGANLTSLSAGNISSGTLAVARGGTGVSASTGSGRNVLSDNATMSNLNIVGGIYQNGVPFKAGVGFDDGTVGFPSITFNSDANTGLYRVGADTIGISTGGVSRVTILDNGNVGFGTNAPEARLHVVGDGYFNGNVIATSNIIGFSTMESDSNVKHHFEPITDALDKIDAIGAYTFEYRGDDSRKRHAGVIAQQVQRVLPEVVDVHPLKDTLTVAYGNLSSLLLAGVQELRDEVNNLKDKLTQPLHCRGVLVELILHSTEY
jgi:hypothetical protein